MNRYDPQGNPVAGASAAALDGLNEAAALFHGYWSDPLARIDAVLAESPDVPMALCLKGGLLASATERGCEAALGEVVDRLHALDARCGPRERGHAVALDAWRARDFARAVEAWGAVLFEFPRDLLALQLAHLGDFYLGHSRTLRDRPARVLPEWDAKTPGYGFVVSMHAFGLEESGQYADAEREGRRALELNRRDPWAVHAVAHVMEMQGRTAEGIAWLEQRAPDWSPDNLFAYHNWWHLALYHLDGDDTVAALKLHDERIRPAAASAAALELIDGTALLWRLMLRGEDVGARWDALAPHWATMADDGYYAFNDAHAMMAFAATGRDDDAARLLAAMERACAAPGTNAAMTRDVGLPVARALRDFAHGRHDAALDALLPVLPVAERFGGSHAQRDVLSLTAVEAALRGRRLGAARALIAERLAARPSSPHNRELAARAGMRLH